MLATSLGHYLTDVHDIYQSTEVSEDLLDDRSPTTYTLTHQRVGKLACPFLWCKGVLNDDGKKRGILGVFIQRIWLWFHQRGNTSVAINVACRLVPSAPTM